MDSALTEPFLEVRGLSKRFSAIAALADVSFTVCRGEVLGLIGPNGAGKTTLLECVCGLLPAAGVVLWNGAQLPPRKRRTVMFYLPDGMAPYPEQTVRQVLRFFAGVFKVGSGSVEQLIGMLELSGVADRRVGRLSKGWRRRLLLGICLLAPQPLILIDEPFDGLDLRQTRHMMNILHEAAALGRTFVLSIHQLTDAERVCDRFVLLSEGRTAGEGTLNDLRIRAATPHAELEDVFLALS